MRFAAGLLVAFVCSGALARVPGSARDCSDMTLYVPGLTCSPLAPLGQPDSRWIGRGSSMAVDNEGFVYVGFTGTDPDGVEIQRSRDGGQTVQVVARINARGAPQG